MDFRKRKSELQERRAASDINGREQPGSGAPMFYKGDARAVHDIRVECKRTDKASFSLKLAELEKIKAEALMGGLEGWAMQVDFQPDRTIKSFGITDWAELIELRRKARAYDEMTGGL